MVCPWCQASIDPNATVCAQCRRKPEQHPSRQKAQVEGDGLSLDLDVELDLDRPAPTPLTAPPQRSPNVAPAAAPTAPGGGVLPGSAGGAGVLPGGEHEPSGVDPPTESQGVAPALSMDLDLDEDDVRWEAPPSAPAMASAAEEAFHPGVDDAVQSGVTSVADGVRHASAEGEEEGLNEVERRHRRLVTLAAYPPRPDSIPGSVSYAWAVLKRRRILRAEAEELSVQLSERQHRAQLEYASIAESARARNPSGLSEWFATVDEDDADIASQRGAMQESEDSHSQRDQELSGELESLRARVPELTQLVKQAQIAEEDARDKHRRAKDELKRAQMQLSAAHESARDAAEEGARFAPPEHARRIKKLQALADANQRQVDARAQQLATASASVRTQRKHLDSNEKAIQNTLKKRRQMDSKAVKEKRAALGEIESVEKKRLEHIEEALRAVMSDEPHALTDEERARVATLTAEHDAAQHEVDEHLEAIETFDTQEVQKGATMVVATIVILVGGLLFLVL